MKTAISTLLLFLTALSHAQQSRVFDQWDQDKDDKLSKQELPESARRNFSKVDTDGSGSISRKEHAAFLKRRQDASQPNNITTERDISYAANDNLRQRLDLFLPDKPNTQKPLPVIVFIHGGAWRAGDKRSGFKRLTPFVESGNFAGVSIGYRLSNEAPWPAQSHDCKAAIRWIRANAKTYNLDPESIAVWGTSAGGHLVAMLGVSGDIKELEGKVGKHLDQTSRIKCVVNFFGPAELHTMGDHPSTMDHNAPDSPESLLIGAPILENQSLAKKASPIAYVTKDDVPILNVHGTADDLVPYQQSVDFSKKLLAAGVSSNLITIKGGGHGNFGKATDGVNRIVADFFDHHLRGKEKIKIEDETLEAK